MESIESSDRGFALTGEKPRLESYRASIVSAEHHVAAVRSLTVDNPVLQLKFPVLERLAAQKI